MSTYNIDLVDGIVKVGFGEPAQNDQIVKDAKALADALVSSGELNGQLVKISGPASLPVAFVLAKSFSAVAAAIACYDPKLNQYVVAISHNPKYQIGDLVD
jgi:CRISPR-associated protein Csx3